MDFKELKNKHSMSEIVERLGLERPGQTGNYRCPVHGEDEHPSLSISLDKELWNCFVCGKDLKDVEVNR